MTSRQGLMLVIVLGFVAFLLWSTLSAQRIECAVTVEFEGRTGTGTASAASEEDAVREAQTAACGPITGSMDQRIACSRRQPATRRCHPV
jgi:hypothetical protein